jgi:predicted O-methyltransferase YrrM
VDTWLNVLRNALRPSYLPVMVRKLGRRVVERRLQSESNRVREWCRDRAESADEFAEAIAPELWAEAREYAQAFRQRASARLARIGQRLGGGAYDELLYFLVRFLHPRTVIETGVAAGYSSNAILSGLRKNGQGTLYSSDFPYFRLSHPENFIGCAVDPALKHDWRLFIEGDRKNLDRLLPIAGPIDLIHYDSDKSYGGRRDVFAQLDGHCSDHIVIMMDDIQDNFFFRDLAAQVSSRKSRVFAWNDKYVGLIGI